MFESHVKRANYRRLTISAVATAMASKDLQPMLANRGIHVTKIDLSPNWERLKVSWVTTNKALEEETAEVLGENANLVREIMQEELELGLAPKVIFVKGT